ncbi:MAG: DUF1016 N-terminal domain-containing protein [Gammaproteobacteria bacterium]
MGIFLLKYPARKTILEVIFPNTTYGFSPRNLWDMRKIYLEYRNYPILRQLVAEIPWGQNIQKN